MKKSRNEARKVKHIRIKNKISAGTSKRPRVVVFKSLNNFEVQAIDDNAQKTLLQSSTLKLKLTKGGNIPAAKVVASDFADKLIAAKINEIVFDRSGYIYHGRVKALAETLREKGVKF